MARKLIYELQRYVEHGLFRDMFEHGLFRDERALIEPIMSVLNFSKHHKQNEPSMVQKFNKLQKGVQD